MSTIQSVRQAQVECVEVWAAAMETGPVWEMENVCVILDTRVICAKAVLMATTERKVQTPAQELVQVRRRRMCQTTVVSEHQEDANIANIPLSVCLLLICSMLLLM